MTFLSLHIHLVSLPFFSAYRCRATVIGCWLCRPQASNRPLTASTTVLCSDTGCACRCILSTPPVRAIKTLWISLAITPSCRQQPSCAGFQLRHRLIQHTLGTLLQQAGICHSVEPAHLRFSREEAFALGRGPGLTKHADILLYAWRGDHRCSVDLVGVSPARNGWKDSTTALSSVEQGKRDKHASLCRSHGFEFIPFGFLVFGSFGPEAQAFLERVIQRYRLCNVTPLCEKGLS